MGKEPDREKRGERHVSIKEADFVNGVRTFGKPGGAKRDLLLEAVGSTKAATIVGAPGRELIVDPMNELEVRK